MKVAELIERRKPQWHELERLCELASQPANRMSADSLVRLASLYRAACADLALAEAYQLPPANVEYLHRLVSQAHNQLYRTRKYQWRDWSQRILEDTPRLIFHDPCVWIATLVFWGLFLAAAFLAYDNQIWPGFADSVVGEDQLQQVEEMYKGFGDRSAGANPFMAGFYVKHNATIGLTCFVTMLLILPGMMTLAFNAVQLGAVFGYMYRPELGDAGLNFKNFVTAHGPFELTAIILSASAGLRIGLGWLSTGGLTRSDSLIKSAREALPIAMCAVILFCLAAIIEGFVSPSTAQQLPWGVKALVAWVCSALLLIYFVILGYPREENTLIATHREAYDET
jgi:uncharacterized membrane protein SpoIIM required for sporulation